MSEDTRTGDSIWTRMVPNWPILVFATIAFICGKLGFSVLILPVVLYFALNFANASRERVISRELREAFAEENLRRTFLRDSTESAVWINHTLRNMWPHLDRWLSSTTTSFLMRALHGINQPDENGKQRSVQLDIKYVSFGKTPVSIDGVTAVKAIAPYDLRLDMDFTYRGETTVELEASVAFLKVPLVLSDLDFRGKLRLDMSFKDKGAIKLMSIMFKQTPTLNFAIKTIGKFDIMDLPTLKETMGKYLIDYMRTLMVYPNALRYDWTGHQPETAQSMSAEESGQLKKKYTYHTVTADDEPNTPSPQSAASLPTTPTTTSSQPTTPLKESLGVSDDPLRLTAEIPSSSTDTSSSPGSLKLSQAGPSTGSIKRDATPKTPTTAAVIAPRPTDSFAKKKEDVNEFLLMSPEEFSGTLRVRVLKCSKLSSSDIFSVSPYVVLEMNGLRHQTAVVKRTTEPSWTNALFEFPVPKYLPAKGLILKVTVYDKMKIGSDEPIGTVLVRLNDVLAEPDKEMTYQYPLTGLMGSVTLERKYITE